MQLRFQRQFARCARGLGAILFAALLLSGPLLAQSDQQTIPVSFAPGTSGAEVSNQITGYGTIDYTLDARAGQLLTADINSPNTQLYMNVIPPDAADEAVFIGSISGPTGEIRLDLDGTWKIRVYLMRAAARREETADFTLKIGITGKPDPSFARQPNDFGPRDWDARGDLFCSIDDAPLELTCPFKVLRSPEFQEASLFVQKTDESVRILYYQKGTFSTDSTEPITATKSGDTWQIDVAAERYEFPDIVVLGD
ncbi:MAG: hypothetical protein AAGF94_16895 [Pseudomonadota bacterium]